MSISGKVANVVRQGGLASLPGKATLYLLRRAAGRTDTWAKRLDFSISSKSLLREYQPLLERNEIFRDRHKGRRCFVIGNGPSLKEQDLSPLADEITLVTNSFYLHPVVGADWQPSYYFLSDPGYFDGVSTPFSFFEEVRERIPSAPFFVPHFARDFLVQTNALPPERTYFVGTCGGMEDSWQGRPDFTRVTPGMQTVVQLAMMAAMYMGCSHIYLLGLDHDWLSHGGEHLNFYSEQEAQSQPDGNLPGWTYKSMMEAVMTMWRIYEMLHRIARQEGIKIINATHGGFLDVFPRGAYTEIVRGSIKAAPSFQEQR
jgi:hypothetical protein